jgi:DNA-directed DNA polymerase III PolC
VQASIPFVHLEVHSHFSLLAATPSPADLAARAAAEGMSAVALTDTSALYGAVAFERACREAGVAPILGMSVPLCQAPATPSGLGSDPPEEGHRPVDPVPIAGSRTRRPGTLVLLATEPEGYRSLCRLSSLIQGVPDRQERLAGGIGWDDIVTHRAGLICLSGGRQGFIERALRAGDAAAAQRHAGKMAEAFDSNAYLALEIHGPSDQAVAAQARELARRMGIGVAAVQPIACLAPADEDRLRLLAAIRLNSPLNAVPPEELPGAGDPRVRSYWPDAAEFSARYAAFPEALRGTAEIAGRCRPALPDGRPIWPTPILPQDQTPEAELAAEARRGLQERFPREPSSRADDRLESELNAIVDQGYAPLFLVVADIVRYARSQDIPMSTRGSVANSLAAYCLGITTVDPLEHGLLFERFLSPARADPPDIDLDLCSRRRDEVLEYVRRTYGPEHVALIGTHSTMRPQSAAREAAKAYGLDESAIKAIDAVLPRGWHPDARRRDVRPMAEVAAELTDPRQREVVQAAASLVGQPDHLSVHAGGVVITPGPLTDIVPVQWSPKGFLITQYEHRDVEALGLPKIDLLGIRALTVLADTAELVRQTADSTFRLEKAPLDDPLTGDLLEQGDTIGVFQCESDGAQRTLRKLKARSVRDLAIANAFFKPGPSTGGMARAFVRRYRGEEPVTYLHPSLEPILAPTMGVLIFQEQILRVAREVAGLSWKQADHLRRGMSKFQPGEMAELREQFLAGCQHPAPDGPGMTAAVAASLWEQVAAFAGYGFNQGHATAYAEVSYRSAYLKAHWPAAFLCARLADWGGFHHPAVYMSEAVRLGIRVNPPHVNASNERFTLTADGETATLWMGLGSVRDLRRSTIENIVAERGRGNYADLRDLVNRIGLQSREAAHLIQCGALDGLGESRSHLLAEAEAVGRASASQLAFAFAALQVEPEHPAQRMRWEQHILGQPVSVHPLELVAASLPARTPLRELPETAGRTVTVAGTRLPGWTGGPGYFLGDGDSFVIVRSQERPQPWQPVVLQGRWQRDPYGSGWFAAGLLRLLPLPE